MSYPVGTIIDKHTFLVDGCLRVVAGGPTLDVAQAKIKQAWPRSTVEYVGLSEHFPPHAVGDYERSQPLRPVAHSDVGMRRFHSDTREVVFAGGDADEATMREMENSLLDAYAGDHV